MRQYHSLTALGSRQQLQRLLACLVVVPGTVWAYVYHLSYVIWLTWYSCTVVRNKSSRLTLLPSSLRYHRPTMSLSSRHTVSSTPQSAKRKHFDEEAQFYADEDESWKKQRTDHDCFDESSPTCSTGSWSTTTNADVTMDRCGEDYGTNPSEMPHESMGEHCYDSGSTNAMDMDVVGDDDATTRSTTTRTTSMPMYTTTTFVTKDATSWSMINTKELRRQSPEKSSVARRDIMKLWRVSSSNATPHSPLPNWSTSNRELMPWTQKMAWIWHDAHAALHWCR